MSGERHEWATGWKLPLVAMWGISGYAILAYSSGVLMVPVIGEFGWSRAEFAFGFTLQMIVAMVAMPIVGRVVDKVGPRRVALAGIVPSVLSFSLMGAAGESPWIWWLLCVLFGLCAVSVAPMVWVTAIVSHFRHARGLALAVSLSGLGVATTIWPVLAALYSGFLGWRIAFPALALTWGLLILPLAFAFFRGQQRPPGQDRGSSGSASDYWRSLKTRTFLFLAVAGGLFSSIVYGVTLHLVPILQARGLSIEGAAGVASLMGIFSIIGRLGTGFLLDRFPTRPLSVAVFLLPILSALLLYYGGSTLEVLIIAVVILGIANGAEMDVVTYIAARQFEQRVFASVYSVIMAVLSVGGSLGPLLAGAMYDATGSYYSYLLGIVPTILAAALLILLIPSPAAETRWLRNNADVALGRSATAAQAD